MLETISQLEHSKEFAKQYQNFYQFNTLKVLRIDNFEIRYSNVLAWLLKRNEISYMLGLFIKKMLTQLVMLAGGLKLVLEIGPLQCKKRMALIKELEA